MAAQHTRYSTVSPLRFKDGSNLLHIRLVVIHQGKLPIRVVLFVHNQAQAQALVRVGRRGLLRAVRCPGLETHLDRAGTPRNRICGSRARWVTPYRYHLLPHNHLSSRTPLNRPVHKRRQALQQSKSMWPRDC
jgi:hypothetical protein